MMRWAWRREWMQKSEPIKSDTSAERSVEELASLLRERGVSHEYAGALATRIEPRARTLSSSARQAFVEGAAISWATHAEAQVGIDRNLKEIKEVERLMGAFSGELTKLDEVLEVLAAYVKRMRTSKAESEPRTLH